MTWKDSLSSALDAVKAKTEKHHASSTTSDAVPASDAVATAATPAPDVALSDGTAHSLPESEKALPTHEASTANDDRLTVPTATPGTMSRSASASSGITKYKEKLVGKIPAGQFEIENATGVALNISLNQVGPLYYDVVKPGQVFSRTTGKVWFTIEVRLHLGPASEYSSWSVAWPIMLMAGPSAAAISLAAIPLVVLMTGTASVTALASTAVEGVTAAFSSVASALGIANRLPFASRYRSKAIGAAKAQAADAQKFASDVMGTLKEKGGVQGMIDELKKRGGEPKKIELPEQPTSVHDITDADVALVFDVKGPGPKGWKKKRWTALKEALENCTLVDRGWYAGREPVLRVVGGPRIVRVENPFPKTPGEMRTILEIYPLRLEKVVGTDGQDVIVEEIAKGEGKEKPIEETVEEAASAMRQD